MIKKYSKTLLFICLMISIFISIIQAETKASAGRKYFIGDIFNQETADILKQNLPGNLQTNWKVGLILFTKKDHTFSNRAVAEIVKINEDIEKTKTFPVWEMCAANTEYKTELPESWVQLVDENYSYYDMFGPKVYPTIFIIDASYKIISYSGGFSPAAPKNIRDILSEFYPEEFEKKVITIVSKEEKKVQRKENLGHELYRKKIYPMALMQLNSIENPSVNARILIAKIHIQLENFDEAKIILIELLNQNKKPDHVKLYLAVIHYQEALYEEALAYLDNIRTIPDMYKIHYWKAKSYEKLKNKEMALKEYKKTVRQIMKNLDNPEEF